MTDAIDKLTTVTMTTRARGYDVRTVGVALEFKPHTMSLTRSFTLTADLHPDRSFALWAAAEIAQQIAQQIEHELAGKIAAELEGKA